MRILVAGDVHWSEFSSILRRMGNKYSKRLENLISSVNWVEEQAKKLCVEKIVYAGDFFDKPNLNANEITALQEIVWTDIPHVFIVGNHEGLNSSLSISSTHYFKNKPNFEVISEPTMEVGFGYELLYLPYIIEKERKPLRYYIDNLRTGDFCTQEVKYIYIISHNDIKMNYGKMESTNGFDPDDIDRNCSLFINGHIHSASTFANVGVNVGNLTGQNFSEDATKYTHGILVLDTRQETYYGLENPYAYNFYKYSVSSLEDFHKFESDLKNNSVLTIKVPDNLVAVVREELEKNKKVAEYRVISMVSQSTKEEMKDTKIEAVNHLEEFVEFVSEKMEVTQAVKEELSNICR